MRTVSSMRLSGSLAGWSDGQLEEAMPAYSSRRYHRRVKRSKGERRRRVTEAPQARHKLAQPFTAGKSDSSTARVLGTTLGAVDADAYIDKISLGGQEEDMGQSEASWSPLFTRKIICLQASLKPPVGA